MITKYGISFIDDGLGLEAAKRYQARRNALVAAVGCPILLESPPHRPGLENPWSYAYAPVYQDPLILYLTGINQTGIALYLSPEKDVLFLKKQDAKTVFWEGHYLAYGSEESATITGFSEIKDREEWPTDSAHWSKNSKQIGLFWDLPKQSQKKVSMGSSYALLKTRLEAKAPDTRFINIAQTQYRQRLNCDKVAIQMAQKAVDINQRAFVELLPNIPKLETETAVCGHLLGKLLAQTPYGLSFSPIVASGPHAAILHYSSNSSVLNQGDLLLLDFGCNWQSMCPDTSRTVPVSGRFNPMQRILYEIVLDTQLYTETCVKAGVSIVEINQLTWSFLNRALEERFLKIGGRCQLDYEHAPHFVSHVIGSVVHDGDLFGDYRSEPLTEGMIISNEPGLYGYFEIVLDGISYAAKLGIRIEDMLLVQQNGTRNLSQQIPKSVQEIEYLMGVC